MTCCGGNKKVAFGTDRVLIGPPQASRPQPPREAKYMAVGNYTGEMILPGGRSAGHVYPGLVIRVLKLEADDPRLIELNQKSLKAMKAMM